MDRGTQWAAAHGIAESQAQLNDLTQENNGRCMTALIVSTESLSPSIADQRAQLQKLSF